MKQYIVQGQKQMRYGYTTGTCAAASTYAAVSMLVSGQIIPEVAITTPNGIKFCLQVEDIMCNGTYVRCAVRKDAGDDPDITNGVLVYAQVRKTEKGTVLEAAEGIGRVTQPGLACVVGEPAINPVPRQMILEQAMRACVKYQYTGGLHIVLSVPRGEELAKKTYNGRLGITGGISILGTTGIVEPMSSKALVDTIKLEIDHMWALGKRTLLLVPGNYGRDFARKAFGIDIQYAVQCSNYIGEALDYAVYKGFHRLVLLGHAGKLVKLAAGIMNTHSSMADGRMEIIAVHAAMQIALEPKKIQELLQCITIDAANELLLQWGILESTWESIAERVAFHLQHRIGRDIEYSFTMFGKYGILVEYGDLRSQITEFLKENIE